MRHKVYFHERLQQLSDVELYKRLHNHYGDPIIIEEALTCNREHANQVQRRPSFGEEAREELAYIASLYMNP